MNKLIKIETENVNIAWNDAMPYLEKALKRTPEYGLMDVYRLVKSGYLTLWMFYNEGKKKPFGAMVTEVVEHPLKRILAIFLLSSDGLDEAVTLFPEFVEYGRRLGADSIECYGRFGLEKLLAKIGFKKTYIALNYDVK